MSFFAIHPVLPTVNAFTVQIAGKERYTPAVAAQAMESSWDAIDRLEVMKVNKQTPCYLFLEEPVVARGGARTTMVQAYVSGAIQACFTKAGYTVYLVNQSKWKSFLGVQGAKTTSGQTKDYVRRAMQGRFPKDAKAVGRDGDLLDAAAIARFGQQVIQRGTLVAGGRGM